MLFVFLAIALYNVWFAVSYSFEAAEPAEFTFYTTVSLALAWNLVTARRIFNHPILTEALNRIGNRGIIKTTYFLVFFFVFVMHTFKHYHAGNATNRDVWWAVYALAIFFSTVFAVRRYRRHRDPRVFFYALSSIWVSVPCALQTTEFPLVATLTTFMGLGWITPAYFPVRTSTQAQPQSWSDQFPILVRFRPRSTHSPS